MINEKSLAWGRSKSCIRELAGYAAQRKAEIGAENVFDFSGVSEFTSDYRNYYDDSHYRPNVTREVLNVAYGKKKETLQDIDD